MTLSVLALKLTLPPMLTVGAALSERRWGPRAAGRLAGLPLNSAPVVLVLAIENGNEFAAATAAGMLAGTAALSSFCAAFTIVAKWAPWPVATGVASAAYLVAALIAHRIEGVWTAALLATLSALGGLIVIRWRALPGPGAPLKKPIGLAGRALISLVVVGALTSLANWTGPAMAGLISPFPVLGATVLAGALHSAGPSSARRAADGLATSTFAFIAFALVLRLQLPHSPLWMSFGLAAAAAAATQIGALARRPATAK